METKRKLEWDKRNVDREKRDEMLRKAFGSSSTDEETVDVPDIAPVKSGPRADRSD